MQLSIYDLDDDFVVHFPGALTFRSHDQSFAKEQKKLAPWPLLQYQACPPTTTTTTTTAAAQKEEK